MRITYTLENIKAQVTKALGPGDDYKVKVNKRLDVALASRITDRGIIFTFNPRRIHRTAKLEELIEGCKRDLSPS